jgi:hypothetical protein
MTPFSAPAESETGPGVGESQGLSATAGQEVEVDTGVITLVDGFVEAFANSDSATELCRTVVHAQFTHPNTVGCQLLWLDHQAELKLVASYGVVGEFDDYSTWAENPLGEAVRSRNIVIATFTPPRLGGRR